MRTYLSTGHRDIGHGSIEIEGRWAGVQWIALGLFALLVIGVRSPWIVGAVGVLALYLFVMPARRRVIFDKERGALRIEHAGLFSEPGRREIAFADLRGVVFEEAGRRGGKVQHAVFARTAKGRVYLTTHAGGEAAAALAREIESVVR